MQLGPQQLLINCCLILTSQTRVLAELQESLDAATGAVQAAAVGHLHGALLAQLAVAAQQLSCTKREKSGEEGGGRESFCMSNGSGCTFCVCIESTNAASAKQVSQRLTWSLLELGYLHDRHRFASN